MKVRHRLSFIFVAKIDYPGHRQSRICFHCPRHDCQCGCLQFSWSRWPSPTSRRTGCGKPKGFLYRSRLFLTSLFQSACKASNCACNKVQGQFCGNQGINPSCTNGHVFECNKSTGKTCDYGVRDSCVKCGKLSCWSPRLRAAEDKVYFGEMLPWASKEPCWQNFTDITLCSEYICDSQRLFEEPLRNHITQVNFL